MSRHKWIAMVGAVASITACREPTGGSPIDASPAVASVLATCPSQFDFVVSDEAGLVAAVAKASPGQVIGVDGLVSVSADVTINTPRITLTCASAGSGLVAGPAVNEMINALADGVVIDGLVLDAGNAIDGPYGAMNASGLRFTHNHVTCGANGGDCGIFFGNTPNAIVSDNEFVSIGSSTGLHMQQGIDGSRVERNTLSATGPSGGPTTGALRIRDGDGVTIISNVVQGPWTNSLTMADLTNSLIAGNRLQGATLYGIHAKTGGTFLSPASMSDNVFRGNRITGAGIAGILLESACRNTFSGNLLQGNAGNLGLILSTTTGANTVRGSSALVVDNGAFDCDGDGLNDPNVTGGGRPAILPVANLSAQPVSASNLPPIPDRLR